MPKPLERSSKTVNLKTKNSLKGDRRPGSKPQDLDRDYDTTQLREVNHGKKVHRDYAAHFFRWGWASRMVKGGRTRVLDVGCGQDFPLLGILSASLSSVPSAYVGVDLNPLKKRPSRTWIEGIYDRFDFPGGGWREIKSRHAAFDLIVNFEVIEHMHRPSGEKLLRGMRECLSDEGVILLSTPVYNLRKMAANHLKEYTIAELQELIHECDLQVVDRFGTFASRNDVLRVCTDTERQLLDELSKFYGGDVLACFLAPKYPNASRNNAWVLKKR